MAKAKRITGNEKNKKIKKYAKILYIFLFILFISIAKSLFDSEYLIFGLKIVAFIIFFGAIKLIDKGLVYESIYNNEKIAFAPKIKYKLFGSTLLGLDIFFINYFINHSNFNSLFIAIITAIGSILYYGLDPSKDKLPQNSSVNMEKFVKDLQEAQKKIDDIKKAQEDILDYDLKNAITKATIKAEHILETIKEDPKDIRVARKFMVVYLDGIKDVIDKYNSIDKEHLEESFKNRLIELLNLASNKFDKELDRLKSNDIFDLDVQIDSLKQQLKD